MKNSEGGSGIFEQKVQECKNLWGKKHQMNKGVYVRIPEFKEEMKGSFVLHEIEHENELENPRKVNQKWQIVIPHHYDIFYKDKTMMVKSADLTDYILNIQSMYSLEDDTRPQSKRFFMPHGIPVLYNYIGDHLNQELIIRRTDDLGVNKMDIP